jgi:crotonobetainyl-CoA:carnitine CoA-transferase CaiB-like acyl-CoA transferase
VFGAPEAPAPGRLEAWARKLADRRGDLPLAGTVVLDFTAFWAGPSATRNLADFGATVIKVERPGSRVDLEDGLADPEVVVMHLYHCKMNRNKLSLALDLNAPEGRDLARRLANQADILVENSRPGVARRLGLDPAELCRTNPALVYVSLSGFGAEGPWGDLPSYGPTIEAASSIEDRTGYAGGEPLRLGHTLPDGVGGLIGTLAALRGLRERAARGVGGWFDLSQFEAYVALSGEEILAASQAGRAPARIGNRSRTGAIQGVFPCRGADEWLALRLEGADDVARFAAVVGRPDFQALAIAVPQDDDALEAMIADFTRDEGRREAAARLQAAGLEAIAVLTPEDLVADPHLRARGFFVEATLEAPLPGSPFHGDRRLADPSGPAPRVGEHGAEVRQALAGIGNPPPG